MPAGCLGGSRDPQSQEHERSPLSLPDDVTVRHPEPQGKAELMVFARRNGVASQIGYSPAEVEAYRQGYREATLLHTTQQALSAAQSTSASTIIPERALEFASTYPLVTTASMGVAAATVLFTAGRGTGWLLRRFYPNHTHPATMGKGVLTARIDDLERRLGEQLQASNSHTRAEFDRIHRTLVNRFDSTAGHKPGTSPKSSLVSGANQVGRAERKDASLEQDRSALVFRDEMDSRLRDLEGQVIMANKDRRVELNGFRSEIMGQLKVLEDYLAKLGKDSGADSQTHRRIEPSSAPESQPRESSQFEQGAPAQTSPTSKYYIPEPRPEDFTAEEIPEARKALWDSIAATKEKYQSIMDALPERPAEMVEAWDKAATEAEELAGKGSGANRKNSSKTPRYYPPPASSLQQPDPEKAEEVDATAPVAATDDSTSSVIGSVAEPKCEAETARKTGEASGTVPAPEAPQGTTSERPERMENFTTPGPRLGIDDTGNWRFVLTPRPHKKLTDAGWRIADVIYETSSSHNGTGPFYAFASMSSGSEIYPDVKLFLYPEFDIARLDGELWRCERLGPGEWTIKEKLGDATQPEWDGVGYAKE